MQLFSEYSHYQLITADPATGTSYKQIILPVEILSGRPLQGNIVLQVLHLDELPSM